MQWLKHYLKKRDFAKAQELVETPKEGATVLKASAMAGGVCCACLSPPGKHAAVEAERRTKFVEAVRSYEWEIAEILAITPEEFDDLAASKARVAALHSATTAGSFERAYALCITQEEADEVHACFAAMQRSIGGALGSPSRPRTPQCSPRVAHDR